MRKIVLSAGVTLDGYLARPDGAVDFLFMPADFSMATFTKTIDTVVMGRKTLDAARKLGGGFGGKTKTYVFSRSEAPGERDGVSWVRGEPDELAAELRSKPGKDIWLMGGGELAREFLQADLVDEIHLGVVPVLLGDGLPLFPRSFPQRDYELLDCRTYSRGLVFLQYRRSRAGA